MGDALDVEHLIESLDQICSARPALEAIGGASIAHDRVDKIRSEVEWFVQHVAERVKPNDARLMWGSVLRIAADSELTVVTTNYDRAIELAAKAEGVLIDDGFAPFDSREIAPWIGFDEADSHPRLVKLHGSTDWYESRLPPGPTKLRHPMPLFGRAGLHLADGQELTSALVLPSREKILMHAPYPRLSQSFLNAADQCDVALFVGSSLRDHHIRSAVQTTARRVPVFVVNPAGDTYDIEGVRAIKQCASTFLIATLPNALVAESPVVELKLRAAHSQDSGGILHAVGRALDTSLAAEVRCRALEELDEGEATLDPFLLRQLLADADARVARYSLGLISQSADRVQLIEEAMNSAHSQDPAFSQDLQLLDKMDTAAGGMASRR